MQWEELTGDEFPRAVRRCRGVCVISLGVIERHGPHLPLGTDMLNGQYVCAEAAKLEPAVVFPPWFLGQIYEAKCFPGAITIPPRLLLELMLTILDEIGRNGFTRIIGYIAHGGNLWLGRLLTQCMLDAPKPYQFHAVDYNGNFTPEQQRQWREAMVTDGGGHAGESETSAVLAHRPELVRMQALGNRTGERLGRLDHLRGGINGFWWYADHPQHWAGDARPASIATGRKLMALKVQALAAYIKAVKNDAVAPRLAREFFRREAAIREKTNPPRRRRGHTEQKRKR